MLHQAVLDNQLELPMEEKETVFYVSPRSTKCYSSLVDAERDLFNILVQQCNDYIYSGCIEECTGGLEESYKWVRSRGGGERRVTHFTTGYVDKDEKGSNLHNNVLCDTMLSEEILLGQGYFACVFTCPWDEHKVIKFGTGPDFNECPLEDGWLRYAAFCIEHNSDGKYPMLIQVHNLSVHDSFYIALLDRYDYEVDDLTRDPDNPLRKQWNAITACVHKWRRDDNWRERCDPEYLSIMEELEEHPDFTWPNDLHDHNAMVHTSSGRVIITDPDSRSAYDTADKLREHGCMFGETKDEAMDDMIQSFSPTAPPTNKLYDAIINAKHVVLGDINLLLPPRLKGCGWNDI